MSIAMMTVLALALQVPQVDATVPQETMKLERTEVAAESPSAATLRAGWVAPMSETLLAGTATEMATDTPVATPLIEYTDAYYTRLTIHKWSSWAMLPMFAAQYFAGEELIDGDAPSWARKVHDGGIVGVATLFGVNTVTGAWNWWDAREDPNARGWRTAHSILMLAADAGFVATAALAEGDKDTHRAAAYTSMGIAVASWVMMLPPLRRE